MLTALPLRDVLFLAVTANVASWSTLARCPSGFVPWPEESQACQSAASATTSEIAYLRAHAFPFDKPNHQSIFDDGLAIPTVNLSLTARQKFAWAASVHRAIWRDAVLPYAAVNEARTDWRQLFWAPLVLEVDSAIDRHRKGLRSRQEGLGAGSGFGTRANAGVYAFRNKDTGGGGGGGGELVGDRDGNSHDTESDDERGSSSMQADLASNATLAEAAVFVNSRVWKLMGKLGGHASPIVFKSEQTPLIYDPLSTILFGYASCTGVSLLLIDALRTLGIPARLAGTPAWHGQREGGNHNWVEVYLGESRGWGFVEGAPAGAGETFDNPCDKWFCNAAHFNGSGTRVFATKYDRDGANAYFPMAWEPSNHDVVGVERTAFYESVCNRC
uniref:Transglutaminase-like domain-containing protein n=1 Tax=Chrysotila carterae TaxID=13221 RepID=A0A7S4C1V1_CHRCT